MAGNNSTEWGWIQPEIAKTTRVCSYDRAAAGWSNSPAVARTAEETVADLHALRQNANVPAPYVMVGHSIGGIFARMYTAHYPDEVVGLALVDASHPEELKRHPALRAETETYVQQGALYPWIARPGLFRLFFASGGELDFGTLSPQQRSALKAMWSAPKYHESLMQSIPPALAMYDAPPTLGSLGDRPLIVLTATENAAAVWLELQKDLATLSTHSKHQIVQGASHAALASNPGHAHQVTEGIQAVIAAVREPTN